MSEDKKEAEKLDLKRESERRLKTMEENELPQRAAGSAAHLRRLHSCVETGAGGGIGGQLRPALPEG